MARSRYIKACFREPVDRVPVWIMRQAGRYLPEYRAVREQVDFLTLCRTPKLAAEVTLQPVRRFGVDAAILFSDILIPVEAMGAEIRFEPGPIVQNPIRDLEAIDALRMPSPEQAVPFVLETIERVRRELPEDIPLIGFGGSPFTLAAYLVEGRGSKDWSTLKRWMFRHPDPFHRLMARLTRAMIDYLNAQIAAGAQAIQVFNTWSVILSPEDYQTFALPYDRQVLAALDGSGTVPRTLFGQGSSGLLELMAGSGADVIGIDWRMSMAEARRRLGPSLAVQGNLDPAVLFSEVEEVQRRVVSILEVGARQPGFVFNLGHGILPETPIESVEALVKAVHEWTPS